MISSEVQRTLVKSPPELWSELSDPASLARHLGELGEIRIVRVQPEKTVEWEAENTTGTVSIQPSGWGTKVTLSVTRELVTPAPDAEPQAAEDEPPAPDTPNAEAEPEAMAPDDSAPVEVATTEIEPAGPEAAELQPAAEVEVEAEAEPASTVPVETQPADEPAPATRRGFFARLFGRRRRVEAPRPDPTRTAKAEGAPRAFAAVSEALAQEAVESHVFEVPTGPATAVEPIAEADAPEPREAQASGPAEPGADIAAELMAAEEVAAEEVAAEEVTAVLAAVLDRLGAAHHRPFSRS